MRKWMRDRLQGRKKKAAEPSDQPVPPPLQPAYFEAEQPSDMPSNPSFGEPMAEAVLEEDRPRAENRAEDRVGRSNSPSDSSEIQPAVPAPGRTPVRETRGRRRRGGRGRGGRGREQAVAQAFAPAAVKGSVPLSPTEPGEDEVPTAVESEGSESARSPKAPAAPGAQRSPKGVVVLAIGLPGSGKSSWFKRHNVVPLSSDMVRTLLFDDVREQRFQDLVFSNLRSMLKARLIARRPMNYVDATNLTPQERQHWIKLAKDYQYEVHAIFFDVPLEVCIERHERRDRVVPEDVMRRMAAKLKAPAFEEGFAKITVVRVKKKDSQLEPDNPEV